ncbi:MAG: hypothetical protein K6G45_13060 [Lachnospiraceae bacterium]|nr:hypothetical protein [Lachnospiraceae bacterium]
MNKTMIDTETSNKIMVDIVGLKNLLSCGEMTAQSIANAANASIKIGKRRLYNVEKIKKYLIEMGA